MARKNPQQRFEAFTDDLGRLADWLESLNIRVVAMEATGVYWIAHFELLDARGFEVCLVNFSGNSPDDGAQVRRLGLSVDLAVDDPWALARRVLACRRHLFPTLASAPTGQQGARSSPDAQPHAKSVEPDEHPTGERHQ